MDRVQSKSPHPVEHKPAGKAFESTQWSLVRAAGLNSAASAEALEQLCRAYWPPIFAHLRMKGHNAHEAEDLAQEFFARLLKGNSFAALTPEKGRFRTFLLAAVKHFLINEWKRETAQKRGGGVTMVDLDGLEPSVREACEPRSNEDPEAAFDRRWALTLLSKVRDRMRREYEAAGQAERHNALKVYLLDGAESVSYEETAATLGLTESAVKSAVYKIRQRFGELLRAEISRTVETEEEVDDELRHLIQALRG